VVEKQLKESGVLPPEVDAEPEVATG